MDELVSNLLLTGLGGIIGIGGSLGAVVLQNRTTERKEGRDTAARFLRQTEMLGAQIIREVRRADELDRLISPGWDLPLIAEREEIALRLGDEAASAADKVLGALTEMLTGTVGSIMRFDEAKNEFKSMCWRRAGKPLSRKRPEEPFVVSSGAEGEVGT